MAIASQSAMEAAPKKKPPTKERRVVVTGMGVTTPVGHDPHTFYENLLEGVSGISEIEAFDCSQYPTVRLFLGLVFFNFSYLDVDNEVHITENCWRDQVFLN